MSRTITTSPNISILDSIVNPSLCTGNFYVDVSPTVFIGSGSLLVLGADVKIVNPYGVTIKNYPTSGFDISADSPPFSTGITYAIPTEAGNYQYGIYEVTVRMTDEDGTQYELTKSVKICVPDINHVQRNYGSLSAKISGICKEGKAYIVTDTPPNYNGFEFESAVTDLELLYPTESQLSPLTSNIPSFSVRLYEGEYKLSGTICATYDYGDNVQVEVLYKVKRNKQVKCIIDECCVFAKLAELHTGLSSKCTAAEIEALSYTALDALRLLKTAKLAAECGEDASDYVNDLEVLLGCQCTCNCNVGTPIINNSPAKDFLITGCNVTKNTVGLTDNYTIENYSYAVVVNPNGNALTVSSTVTNGCVVTTTLNFNIASLYAQIANIAYNDYGSWAAIINRAWTGLDVACLGLTQNQWNALNYAGRTQVILDALCSGGSCVAVISTDTVTASGSNAIFSWVEVSGVYAVDVYMDDILRATVLAGVGSATIIGAADGLPHTYTILSKCQNGVAGNALDGSFEYFGCPTIAVPVVSLTNVPAADCPYDLTALVSALPSGIEAEWHNANNTNASSLVADDTNVADGSYYVFAKNADNCYSLGVRVVVVCTNDTSCSAPQGATVDAITGGYRVRFISAAFAPVSYTVKRRLSSDPDVNGSYTTIGTPTYNAGVSRWEILDATGADNTLYVYKIISNCTATAPFILYTFANIACPVVTLTSTDDTLSYSFPPVGGNVDKYEVELYNSTGTTRLSVDTHTPSFANPTTGTFPYTYGGTGYMVRMKVYIGTYVTICSFQSVTTGRGDNCIGVSTSGEVVGTSINVTAMATSTTGSSVAVSYSVITNFGTYGGTVTIPIHALNGTTTLFYTGDDPSETITSISIVNITPASDSGFNYVDCS